LDDAGYVRPTEIYTHLLPFLLAALAALILNRSVAKSLPDAEHAANEDVNFFLKGLSICVKQTAAIAVVCFLSYMLGRLIRWTVDVNTVGSGGPLLDLQESEYAMIDDIALLAVPVIAVILLSKYAVHTLHVSKLVYLSSLLLLFALSPLYVIALLLFYY